MRSLLSWVILALLSACGGGSGGGSSGGGLNELTVHFSASSLQMQVLAGSTGNSGAVSFTATTTGTTTSPILIGADINGVGVLSPIDVSIQGDMAVITVTPDASQPAGTYTGTITALACKDQACQNHHRGSPYTLPYSVTVVPRLASNPTSASLSAPEGSLGRPQTLALSLPAGVSTALIDSVVYNDSASGWLQATLQTSAQGPQLQLSPSGAGLRSGVYSATVNLHIDQPLVQTVSVPVSFNVSSGLLTPATQERLLSPSSTPTDLQGSTAVTLAPGAASSGWSASSNAAWLVVDRSSGSFAQPLDWHVDAAALVDLPYGEQRSAVLHVDGGSNVSAQDITVRITNQLPRLTSLDTLALKAGQGGEVLVWGEGLTGLSSTLTELSIDGGAITPSAAQRVSDGMLSLTLPALSAGAHTLTLSHAAGVATPVLTLHVLNPVDRSYTAFGTEGTKRNLVWDAVSQSAYVINTTMNSLMRFDLSGPSPVASARSFGTLNRIVVARNHSRLHATTTDGQWLDLDLSSLQTLQAQALNISPLSTQIDLPLAITGDNLAWLDRGSLLVQDLNRNAERAVYANNGSTYNFGQPWGVVSPNGRRMLVTQTALFSPAPPPLWRDASGGVSTAATDLNAFPTGQPITFFYRVASDRTGSRWALESAALYDFGLNKLGDLSLPSGWVALRTALSGDGSRAYVYALNQNAIGTYSEPNPIVYWPRIYVFDTTSAPTLTTSYPLLNFIELPDYPACLATQGPVVCAPYELNFALTDDDRTLLAMGDRKLLVIPIPTGPLRASLAGLPPQASHRVRVLHQLKGATGMPRVQ
ncbi:hypothetical protein [Leptothrix ochracea]|uniref:hypothetical protein n=1 Tax=Leptothrix ochracea TaxID=735331 RepID=UPI0034E1991D